MVTAPATNPPAWDCHEIPESGLREMTALSAMKTRKPVRSAPDTRATTSWAPSSPKTAPDAPTVAVNHELPRGSAVRMTAALPATAESR